METKAKRSEKVAATKATKSKTKVAATKATKPNNSLAFNLSSIELKMLSDSFNELYTLLKNKVNNLNRIDLFKQIKLERKCAWENMNTEKVIDAKLSCYLFVKIEIAREIDEIKGRITAGTTLEVGQTVALKVSESTSTGVSTIQLRDVMPIVPGDSKMVKSLAKRKVSDGKLFAIKERKVDGYYITVYRVRVTIEIVDGKEIKNKVATKESNFIQRYSNTETAFKRGLVDGLRAIV